MSEEKLNELKEKVAGLQEELKELTPEEIEKVFGGAGMDHEVKVHVNFSGESLSNMTLFN